MSLTTRVGLLASASALACAGASLADDPTGNTGYEARIAELEAQVAQLTGDNWLTDQRAEEIKGLVQDVLADADTRASLLQSGMTSGYDHGFMIGSTDGNFSLKINGHMQVRFVYNSQEGRVTTPPPVGQPPNTADKDVYGFENTRTRLIFSGHVLDPSWTYYIDGGFQQDGGSGGDLGLRDAWIAHDFGNGFTLKVGQYKAPIAREFLVDSMNQLAIERSINAYTYGGGRTQGAMLEYAADQWHVAVSIDDLAAPGLTVDPRAGIGFPANTFGLNTPSLTADTEFSVSSRVEVLFMGNWDQFKDFTSPMGSEQGLMGGFGVHWEKGEFGSAAINELEFITLTGDLSAEFDGWNLFASIGYNSFDNDGGATAANLDFETLGFTVQGGVYLTDRLEAFARYEYGDWDDFGGRVAGSTNFDDLNILTFGFNNYYSDNIKASVDFGFAFDAVAATNPITGFRTDNASHDGQYVLRSQIQLTF